MNLTKLYRNRSYQRLGVLLAADALVFILVDPYEANAVWLMVGYALLALTIVVLLVMGSRFVAELLGWHGRSRIRLVRYAAVVLISMVGLQSVGQLTVRDVVTLLGLASIAYWYFGYGSKQKATPTSSS